jgi:hypothetical protein
MSDPLWHVDDEEAARVGHNRLLSGDTQWPGV